MSDFFGAGRQLYCEDIFVLNLPKEEYHFLETHKVFWHNYFANSLKYVLSAKSDHRRNHLEVMEETLDAWFQKKAYIEEIEANCPLLYVCCCDWVNEQVNTLLEIITDEADAEAMDQSFESKRAQMLSAIRSMNINEKFDQIPLMVMFIKNSSNIYNTPLNPELVEMAKERTGVKSPARDDHIALF